MEPSDHLNKCYKSYSQDRLSTMSTISGAPAGFLVPSRTGTVRGPPDFWKCRARPKSVASAGRGLLELPRYNRLICTFGWRGRFCLCSSSCRRPFWSPKNNHLTFARSMQLARIGDPQVLRTAGWSPYRAERVDSGPTSSGSISTWSPRGRRVRPIAQEGEQAALVARFQAHRLRLGPRGLADLADGCGRREPEAGDEPFDRNGRGPVFPRRQEPGFHERGVPRMRRERRLQQAEVGRREERQSEGAHYTSLAVPALDSLAGRAAQPFAGRSVSGGAAKDLTPGDARSAAVLAGRSGRLRHFARRTKSVSR